jgi:hypothetical protein
VAGRGCAAASAASPCAPGRPAPWPQALLIEISLGWVGNKLGGALDGRYKLPRMRYKGEVVAPQRIRADDKCAPRGVEGRTGLGGARPGLQGRAVCGAHMEGG